MMVLFGQSMTVSTSIPRKTFNNTRWHSYFWGWWPMRDCLATSEAILFSWIKFCTFWVCIYRGLGLWCSTNNTISVISWRSVSLVEETGVPGKNKRPVACHWKTLSHKVYRVHLTISEIQSHNVSGGSHWLYK
jgi:hypothetical protein